MTPEEIEEKRIIRSIIAEGTGVLLNELNSRLFSSQSISISDPEFQKIALEIKKTIAISKRLLKELRNE